MKIFFKVMLILVIFIYSLIYFLPKENIYYFALEKLENNKVSINTQNIKDDKFSLKLNNLIIFYNNIQALKISSMNFNIFLFNNNIQVSNIELDDMLKQFLPSKIKTLEINYSIFNPLFVTINADLIQAKAYGNVDISRKTIILNIKPSKKFLRMYSKLLKNMKKQTNGEYRIEYKL
jgi:hypothetical protein